jgi:hypothetical protein
LIGLEVVGAELELEEVFYGDADLDSILNAQTIGDEYIPPGTPGNPFQFTSPSVTY